MTKESKKSPYNKLIFRETFNSEQTTLKNCGTPHNVIYSNGLGEFKSANSAYVNKDISLKGTYSIRMKLRNWTMSSYTYLFSTTNVSGASDDFIRVVSSVIQQKNNGAIFYVNGEPSTAAVPDADIVVTNLTFDSVNLKLGAYITPSNYSTADWDLFEIYEGNLTASEVYNLHHDNWNKELNGMGGQVTEKNIVVNGNFESAAPLETGWENTKGTPSKVSGSGWESQAQRLYADLTENTFIVQEHIDLVMGCKYLLKYSVRSNNGHTLYSASTGPMTKSLSLIPIHYEKEFTATSSEDILRFYVRSSSGNAQAGDFIEIDNVSLHKLNNKTLLDFDSTNGVISEKLAGSTDAEDIIAPLDFTNGTWNKLGETYNTFLGGGLYKASITEAGKSYKYNLAGNSEGILSFYDGVSGATLIQGGMTGDFNVSGIFTSQATSLIPTAIQFTGPDITELTIITKLTIQEIIPELTNTSVYIKKTGSKTSADFNGSTSKIDVGYDPIGTKAVTVMGWVDGNGGSETDFARILSNEKFLLREQRLSNLYQFSSDGITYASVSTTGLDMNKKRFIAITRERDGTMNPFIGDLNTAPALSLTANQNSGTPIAGTTNLIVGNNDGQTLSFKGTIPKLKIVEGMLDLKQITQYWSSTRGDVQ